MSEAQRALSSLNANLSSVPAAAHLHAGFVSCMCKTSGAGQTVEQPQPGNPWTPSRSNSSAAVGVFADLDAANQNVAWVQDMTQSEVRMECGLLETLTSVD